MGCKYARGFAADQRHYDSIAAFIDKMHRFLLPCTLHYIMKKIFTVLICKGRHLWSPANIIYTCTAKATATAIIIINHKIDRRSYSKLSIENGLSRYLRGLHDYVGGKVE